MGYVRFLAEDELLVLLVTLFLGLAIGQIKTSGFKLDAIAVLSVGLTLTVIKPEIQISLLICIVGLALFVYTIGLEVGPESSSSLCSCGIKHNLLGIGVLAVVTIELFLLIKFLSISPMESIGAFAGALVNTPAMATVVDTLPSPISDRSGLAAIHDIPVIGYFLAYSIDMLAVIVSVGIMSKVFRVDHDQEAIDTGVIVLPLYTRDIKVLKEDLPSTTDLPPKFGLDITISRIEHKGHLYIPSPSDTVPVDNIISVVGTEEGIACVPEYIDELIPGGPTHDGRLDFRRIFISASGVIGVPIIRLQTHMDGMIIICIHRGNYGIITEPNMRLELNDRIRMIATPEKIGDVTKFSGDSYKKLSNADLLSLTLELALGVLVGLVKIPLSGGSSLALGSAGDPLVVALTLGTVDRTGPLVWLILYSAGLTSRAMGLTLFLVGISTATGKGFQAVPSDPASLTVLGPVVIIAFSSAPSALIVGHRVLKISFGQTADILPGLQTHSAVLSYVNDQARDELPTMEYATVYPTAMIMKIILAQVLIMLML